MRRARLRSLWLLGVLIVASVPVLAVPALADDFDPEIVSFRRTSEGLLGGHQLITIEFTARDEGPAGLAYAMFTFRTPLRGEVRVDSPWMNRSAEGTFVATHLLSPWAASGTYTLEKVEVSDREWNSTTYERASPGSFDFAAADFTVENPNEDITAPTMPSARLFQDDVFQGTPVVVLYDARDDLSGVEKVTFTGWSPTRGQYWIESLPQLGAVGPASWIVPLAAASGTYDSMSILIQDRAGNMIHYDEDGGPYVYPADARHPPHEHADPGGLDFVVHGTTGDRVPPRMTSLSRRTPDRRRLGDVVALDYSAFDTGTGIEQVGASWTDGRGHAIHASKTCGDRSSGLLSVTIEDYRSLGTDWKLEAVSFSDYLYNQTSYLRDGRVLYQNGDPGPEPTHTFDLSVGDFHLEDGPPADEDIPDTSALYCPRTGGVSLGLDDADVLFGDVVTTTGTVTIADAAVDAPLIAVHQYLASGPRFVGVVQGDDEGAYRKSFVARASGEVAATFLGVDGPAGAGVSTSRKIPLDVRPRIRASFVDDQVLAGGRTSLTGKVVPARRVQRVLLQLREGTRWRTVADQAPGRDGAFSFVISPAEPGRFTYRVKTPAGGGLSPGLGAPQTLDASAR